MTKIKVKFIDGCKNTGVVNEEEAAQIFGWIQEGQRYLFCKSHGIGYSLLGYWTAYAKAHFPLHFYTAWLYYAHEKIDPQDEVKQLVSDARYFGINICPPNFKYLYNGDPGKFSMYNNTVYFGINDIKKIGESHVNQILISAQETEKLLERTIDKWTWYDFLIFFSDNVSQTVINGLVAAGATDYMGSSRCAKIHEYNEWKKLTQKERDWIKENCAGHKAVKEAIVALLALKKLTAPRRAKIDDIIQSLDSPSYNIEDDAYYIVRHEQELLGIPLTCNKLDTCKNFVSANSTCKEFLEGKTGKISLSVEIVGVSEYIIKQGKSKGQKMLFLQLEDDTGVVESAIVFPNVLAGNEALLINGSTVVLEGQRDKKRTDSFIIENIIPI